MTAIEVLVALLLLSVVGVFSMHVLEFTRRAYLEVEQLDTSNQIARDILNELKAGADWRALHDRWQDEFILRAGTQFNVQLSGTSAETQQEGVSDVEVTISWIGPKGAEQQVFTTTTLDFGEEL